MNLDTIKNMAGSSDEEMKNLASTLLSTIKPEDLKTVKGMRQAYLNMYDYPVALFGRGRLAYNSNVLYNQGGFTACQSDTKIEIPDIDNF